MRKAITPSLMAVALAACSAPEKSCQIWETGVALGRKTPNGEPVMFVHYACARPEGGVAIKTEYVDLHGKKWPESQLGLAKSFLAKDNGEMLTARELTARYSDYRELIARYAICKEIVPRPPSFTGDCEE